MQGCVCPESLKNNVCFSFPFLWCQVWAGVIGTGPHGAPLEATYALSSDTLFQDELGAAVLEACRTIPHGVLLFFPSYSLLDRCSARWKVSGGWVDLPGRSAVSQLIGAWIQHFRGGIDDGMAAGCSAVCVYVSLCVYFPGSAGRKACVCVFPWQVLAEKRACLN